MRVSGLTLNFQGHISNLLYLAKYWPISKKENQSYRLKFRSQTWPWGLTLAITLTLDFQGQFPNCFSHEWLGRLMWNEKVVNRLLTEPTDMWVISHAWPKPWILKVKFWNSPVQGMEGLIDIEQKGCESVIHDHDLDLLVTRGRSVWIYRIVIGVTSTHIILF